MEFQIEKCFVNGPLLPLRRFRELLQYKHDMTCCLLDLQLLDEEIKKYGAETITTLGLSAEETLLLGSFASPKRRREWLAGRLSAKYAAAGLLHQTKSPAADIDWSGLVILVDDSGRPFLAGNNSTLSLPDISISHSGSLAAGMAVNKGSCGIDIQKTGPKVKKVLDRFCTPDEKKLLHASFPVAPDKQFVPLTKLWAAKEALRKVSALASLPGFLELELVQIEPSQENADLYGFIFNWKSPDNLSYKKCRVAVTLIKDYALALTARDDTVDRIFFK